MKRISRKICYMSSFSCGKFMSAIILFDTTFYTWRNQIVLDFKNSFIFVNLLSNYIFNEYSNLNIEKDNF